MTPEQEERMHRAIAVSIEKNVNGHIRDIKKDVGDIHKMLQTQDERSDAFEKKVDAKFSPDSDQYILKEVVPFIQAKAGLKVVRDFLIWTSGGVLAWAAIKSYLPFSWK